MLSWNRLRLGTSEIEITPIIMGTWQAGKVMWAGIDDAETSRAIRAAYDAGINTFDTAESYGKGHSERIVGEALAPVRDRVILATKVASHLLQYDQVIEACHRSLENLRTDYIDLYQIHWPAGSFKSKIVPIEETMRAMNDLEGAGQDSRHRRVQLLPGPAGGSLPTRPDREPPAALLPLLAARRRGCDALLPGERHHPARLFTHGPGAAHGQIRQGPQVCQGGPPEEEQAVQAGARRAGAASAGANCVRSRRAAGSHWGSSRSRGSSHNPARVRSRVHGMPNRSWRMRRRARFDSPRPIWPGWTRSGAGSRIPWTRTRSCGNSDPV